MRREGAIAYEKMLDKYVDLVRRAENPEDNPHYPESIRHSGALRALYDNCNEEEALAIALDRAVRSSKEADFRHNEFKQRKIKQALYAVLGDKGEVERIYGIVAEQGEY
jgi:type I restriction enzyme R subunit